jgi:hypothetical protein
MVEVWIKSYIINLMPNPINIWKGVGTCQKITSIFYMERSYLIDYFKSGMFTCYLNSTQSNKCHIPIRIRIIICILDSIVKTHLKSPMDAQPNGCLGSSCCGRSQWWLRSLPTCPWGKDFGHHRDLHESSWQGRFWQWPRSFPVSRSGRDLNHRWDLPCSHCYGRSRQWPRTLPTSPLGKDLGHGQDLSCSSCRWRFRPWPRSLPTMPSRVNFSHCRILPYSSH